MVKLNNINISKCVYNNKKYAILKVPYKTTEVPIILDRGIYDKIKNVDVQWNISPNNNGTVYTMKDNKILYLHEIVYYINNNIKNKYPIVHLNKIGLDNRYENLIEDSKYKQVRKNLNKKARTIKLNNIDVDNLPSFVWYLKPDTSHGERFQVDLGNIKWKSTSIDKLSLKYKLEETKKFLRQYKERNAAEFTDNSMNSDLNAHGIKCKQDFYNILNKVNMIYDYNLNNNTDMLLKEDVSGLNNLEKQLLKEFDIRDNKSTYDRFLAKLTKITNKN